LPGDDGNDNTFTFWNAAKFRDRRPAAAGFKQTTIEPTRVYRVEDARQFLSTQGIDPDSITAEVEGRFMSAFIRATKPDVI
jgi:hypothetical protein